MRNHVLAPFALALLVAPSGCAAETTSPGPQTSDPISTTDLSACGPGAIASVMGTPYRITPMVADDQGIVLGLDPAAARRRRHSSPACPSARATSRWCTSRTRRPCTR